MARPRRTTEEEFYDIFGSWEPDDQAMALRVMTQIHRIAQRKAKPAAPARTAAESVTESPAPTFNALRDRIAGQPSLSGLPDEDQGATA